MKDTRGRRAVRRGGKVTSFATSFVVLVASACSTVPAPSPERDARADGEVDVFALSAEADRAYDDSRWLNAARLYTRLTRAVPDDAYAWFRLGNIYARQGDYGRAIRAYETSLERDDAQPKPWFNLATAHLLHAQVALLRARERLGVGDPARVLIEARLEGLRTLVHGRLEETANRAPGR